MAITITDAQGNKVTVAGLGGATSGENVTQAIEEHNTSTEAHSDIREALAEHNTSPTAHEDIRQGLLPTGGLPGQLLMKASTEPYNIIYGTYPCNQNLLINSYFVNPVNQRGQTEYSEDYGYNIDRWASNYAVITLEETGLTLKSTHPEDNNTQLWQVIESKAIGSGQYTLSLLVDELIGTCTMGYIVGRIPIHIGLNTITFDLPKSDTNRNLYLLNYLNGTIKIRAAKLELGNQQTLAHQDSDGNWILNEIPNYSLELLKCQRYLVKIPRIHTLIGYANAGGVTIRFKPSILDSLHSYTGTVIPTYAGKPSTLEEWASNVWIDGAGVRTQLNYARDVNNVDFTKIEGIRLLLKEDSPIATAYKLHVLALWDANSGFLVSCEL